VKSSLLAVEGLCVDRGRLRVLDDVTFALEAGETLGIVGESGSGKSTLARAVLRLLEPVRGRVCWRGRDLLQLPESELRRVRREMQIIFQDPTNSLDPRMTVAQSVAEPLAIHRLVARAARQNRVLELLRLVELGPELLHRHPHQISGGQAQRVALARGLSTEPALLVADEALSALDVSLRAQMANLLRDLRASLGIACLFVSHDLRLAAWLCDRIAVLSGGRLVEIGEASALVREPRHAATRALIEAAELRARWTLQRS
jgi:ABC-type glutathione transport system ATPase component